MALLIKSDGTSKEVEVPKEGRVDFYQECVGGFFTTVPTPQVTHLLLVNEEGALAGQKSLPVNKKASAMVDFLLVGDCLLVKVPEEFD